MAGVVRFPEDGRASSMVASTASGHVSHHRAEATQNETERELSRTLERVLKISGAVVALSAAAAPFSMTVYVPTLCLHAFFALVLGASYFCLRAGKRRAAGAVVAGGFWLVATGAVFAFGGARSPGTFVYLPVVAVAGLFWSRGAATLLAMASACSVLVAAQLEALGGLPEPLAPIPPARLWTVFCASLLITAVLFFAAVRRLSTLGRDLAQSRTLLEDLAAAQEHAERERNELEQRLPSVERLQTVAELAGGAAHDFNNQLSIILNASAMLRRHVSPGSIGAELLGEVDAATRRSVELVRKVLSSRGKQPSPHQRVDLNRVVGELSGTLARVGRTDIEVVTSVRAEHATVFADAVELEQIVMNLVLNARDAMPRGGRLRIETANGPRASAGEPGFVALVVSDDGVGMDAATASRIFEPFFTTKGTAGGTGLGLASVKHLVARYGGRIELETAPGRGARFQVLLPRASSGGALTSAGEIHPA
jgi:signal transduction histidine kinase